MENLIPLLTLNLYLLPEFRTEILTEVLEKRADLPETERRQLIADIKEYVRISGFRKPLAAPEMLIVRQMDKIFQEKSAFVRSVLVNWYLLHDALAQTMQAVIRKFDFPENPNAPLFPDPENAFISDWPEKATYEALEEQARLASPKLEATRDQIVLMAVVLAGCLPESVQAET